MANCEVRLTRFARRELQPLWGGVARRLDLVRQSDAFERLRAALASYSGHVRHGGAYRRWAGLWQRHGSLRALFVSVPAAPNGG